MHAVGSVRPGFISSLSRLSRYSTESPSKGRPLAREWGGIVIPSRQELMEKEQARKQAEEQAKEAKRQEARRKAEAYQADISYLEKAPEKSLAGRLARAEPKVRVEPPSREDLNVITQRRREARLARDAEKANAVMRDFAPSREMLKAVEAVREAPVLAPRMPKQGEANGEAPARRAQISQDDFFANFTPNRSQEKRRHRQEEARKPTTPSIFLEQPVQQAVPSQVEMEPVDAATPQDDGLFKFTDLNEKLAHAAETEEGGEKKASIKETAPVSQRQLEASLAAKKREERLRRKEMVFARDLPDEAVKTHPSLPAGRQEVLAASIAKRKEQRLRRERQRAEDNPNDYSLEKRERKRRGPNLRKSAVASASEEEEFDISPGEDDKILPEFTGPEPISATLSELIGYIRPSTAVSNLSKSGDYSDYISPYLKFDTPPDELHPVHLAQLTLSRRAGLSLPQRKHAIDVITQAFQPRSSRSTAKA
ncbi:hypothetical protein CPB84DRAFT_1354080 [Gymnopilus junonius]|uniref:Uncharacterized protein n=1 Tax=Gymnopilus junonius TaxID=109634 RepID=A0A9P5NZT9_GYMJU|nr:hypothetical protein CPB84DRAFT_1354080 [Gymnopilus junonius]